MLTVTHRGDFLLYNPHGYNPASTATGPQAQRLPGAFWLEHPYLDHLVLGWRFVEGV